MPSDDVTSVALDGASLLVASRFTGAGPQKAAPTPTVSLSVSVASEAVGLHLKGTF